MATHYRTAAPSSESGIIVDLSEHAEKLLNYKDIAGDLTDEQENKLVEFVKTAAKMSYDRISKRYSHWREADRAHDVYVPADATQFREKAVIADTRAIADTVLTYLMAALGGRNPMFQLEGLNRNSRKTAGIMERVLHQHMRRTAGEARLAQMLLDSIRYGFAPTKVTWDNDLRTNNLVNFDPRRVFPDPRVQWGDWNRMQYIVFTDFASYDSLRQTGLYPKLEQYPALRERQNARTGWEIHQHHQEEGRGLAIDPAERDTTGQNFFTIGPARPLDEAWLRLSGHQIGMPGLTEVWLVTAVLDESVIVRLQLNPYGRQFPVVIGGLYNDSHKTYGQSLYDLLLPLHDVATWLLRSRIDNVQASLNNLIFADPTQVSIPDLIDRNPWGIVRTMPGSKPGDGVFISEVPDVTRGHWEDIQLTSDLKQRLSAASDAQQGMPTADVRTATEIQRLTQLGSQRLGVVSRILSATTVRPMVRMMVANIQDSLDFEGSVRVDPDNVPGILQDAVQDDYIDFSVKDLQGEIDYLVVDGTLPLEPTRDAETWLNILQVSNQTGLNLELDTKRMALEAIRAMGVSDIDQYRINQDQQQQEGLSPSQKMALIEKMRGASVQGQDSINSQVDKGNLVPLSQAPNAPGRRQ